MVENTTILKDPDKIKNDKKFTFDYSYWSHDGYEEQDDGYYAPLDPRYADQRKVFDDLGRGVLANAWEGFNCSLFAYGQTGSGKSYSIFGYDKNKGIVPATCKQLFEEIDQKPTGHYPVTVSMVEIYNEKVKDLLSNKTDLKIRENAKTGFYVKDLKVQTVVDYEGIQLYIDKGNSNRTVAKTVMNDTSSRAHTIFTLTLAQTMGAEMRKTSVINLVDLAGSERVGRNDVKGKIFDEGKNINLSLLTLGNCINSIVKNEKPAFRNSVMTKLLKNALGGNSKTIMLAALSPSDSDYGETLSTLRFADRAKQIKTKAVVNEDPNVKLIRELREEIAKLKDQLQQTAAPTVPMEKYTEVINKNEEQIKSLQTQLEKSAVEWESRMRENEKSIRADLKEKKAQKKKRKRNPHIWSLNSDIMLSGAVVQYTPVGQTTVGSSKESNIQILGIQSEHTVITNEENEHIFISPVSEETTVRVNGIRVTEKTTLAHHDRILFGSVDLFVFEHPYELAKLKRNNMKPPKASFELARSEIFLHCSYEDLLEQDSTFLKGFTEDEYKKMKEDFIKKQEEEAQMLNSNHENAQVDYEKRFAEEIGKLVEWQGKLADEAEKEHTQQREALEAEIRILRSDKNANETENVAKVKVLELHKIMYADAAVRKLEKQKQWYDMKIGKLNEEFDKDIKMKDFEQERTQMLNDLEQLEQNEERMQNMKQKYKNDADKLQAEKDHKYVKEKLKEMQLLLKNMEQTDPKQNAMHLIEYENQCQILQQIQKKRNQEKFPHFWNLNEEPDLCKVIIHMVMPGESTIGSAEKAKIKISGHGILENHALVDNDRKDVYIQPLADNIHILVNGKVVSGKQKLQDNDRIYFGPNHLYVLNKPQDGKMNSKQTLITYKTAWTEITSNASFIQNTKIINNLNGVPPEEVKLIKHKHLIQLHRLHHRLKRAEKDLERKRQQGQTLHIHVVNTEKRSRICLLF